MKIKEIRIRRELLKAWGSNKWEKCMFGYVIHLPNATIRLYAKQEKSKKIKCHINM